jgi:hypothetical protein
VEAQQSLEQHQLQAEILPVDPISLEKEQQLHKNLHQACRQEEEYWRQKSRSLWLQSGDKNTNFFHKQAEGRKQFNSIKEISLPRANHLQF